MKNKYAFIFLAFIFLIFGYKGKAKSRELPKGYPITDRTKECINQGWRFLLGSPTAKNYQADLDDSSWELVSVPHTLKLTSLDLDNCKDDKRQLTFQRDVGWYRRNINVSIDNNKKVFLEFEGAHQRTTLWVNGIRVGEFDVGGYTPFQFDISNYVEFGKTNQITLLVDNRRDETIPPDPGPMDYIKFSGLYRDVYLVETNKIRITNNIEGRNHGVTITTPSVDVVNKNATIDIRTTVQNENPKAQEVTLLTRIVDANGKVVLRLEDKQVVAPNDNVQFFQIGGIEDNLHLWSVDLPYLYKVNSQLIVNGSAIDCIDNTIGIRSFRLDSEKGFMLNEEPIELIGMNRHQHIGYVGDAISNSIHYKDILQLKQMGMNVVRTAHYTQDDALIQACDELGMLVYEEAPTWISISSNSKWWDNLEEGARTMIRNHRNHPSIVIWGAGINHRGYVPRIHYACKQEDPTRLTASQSSRWTGWQSSGLSDIFANMNYGPVMWDRNEPLFAMEGRRGPEVIAKYKRDPKMPGMISWTAHAYYTFHDFKDPKAWGRTRLGMTSVFRYLKDPQLLWYPTEMLSKPQIHFANQYKKQEKELTIYSNCDALELFINDKFWKKVLPSDDKRYEGLDHPPYHVLNSQFKEGSLKVVGLMNGVKVVEESIITPQKAVGIRLNIDDKGRNWIADDSDLLIAHAEIVDENGTIVEDGSHEIEFEIEGDAKIIGDKVEIGANPISSKYGNAPVLLQAGISSGKIILTAKAKGLKSARVVLTTNPNQTDMILMNAYSIEDHILSKVDLGADDQLVQFGWTPWNGKDNKSSMLKCENLGGYTASIKTESEEGVIRWLGEMNVMGKDGFVYGEGIVAIDKKGVVLTFDGLREGSYCLKTYHHAPSSNTDSMDPNLEKLRKQRIHTIPSANELACYFEDARGKEVTTPIDVTKGKECQSKDPGMSTIQFYSDGVKPVKVHFADVEQKKGVWLNGYILTQIVN